MSITSFDPGFVAAAKQFISWVKTATRTTVAAAWFSLLDVAGNPGAGVLAGTSTTTGVVPTDATAGFPTINAFAGGATGYLAQLEFGSSVACRIKLYDLLWKGGAYAFNANTSGNTPASCASRVPGGTDFKDTQLFIEFVTASTGTQSVAVTYINQDGVAGRTTGTVVTVAGTVGRVIQLPLQAGDSGIQGVTGVVGTVATAGTFNILVMRPIWTGRVKTANDGDTHDIARTGMAEIYADSALYPLVAADSTSSGIPELEMVIANA